MFGFGSFACRRQDAHGPSAPGAAIRYGMAAVVAGTVVATQAFTGAAVATADVGAATDYQTVSASAVRTAGRTQSINPGTEGQCTWGAAQKWFEASGSYPAMRGNALDWRDSAAAAGYTVVDQPQDRSMVVFQPGVSGAGGYGHVAWVDSVSADGQSIHVTEMNNVAMGGVGIFNDRDVRNVPGMSYILMP
jgi:surface antigen